VTYGAFAFRIVKLYDEGCTFWHIKLKVDDESVKYYSCVMPKNEEKSDLTSKLIVLRWKTVILSVRIVRRIDASLLCLCYHNS